MDGKDNGELKIKKTKTALAAGKKAPLRTTGKRASTPLESDVEDNATQLTPPTTLDRPRRGRGVKRSYDEISIKEEIVDIKDEEDDGITVGEDIGQGELF